MADAAFLAAAQTMMSRHATQPTSAGGSSTSTSGSSTSIGARKPSFYPSWIICYKCGATDHKSPACPVIGSGVSNATRNKVFKAIAAAPISNDDCRELTRIARSYYDKIDRQS